MIRFDDLSKRYGALVAVRSLTLEVRPGEVYALLGPNGAGKTTALRCLATLLEPSGGSASVGGSAVQDDPLGVRRNLGFLAASMGLYERLTPVELLTYFGRLQRVPSTELDQRVERSVEVFGIGEFRAQACGTLSTGQRQRVSIARAVIHDPPALVLDEPTLGLDLVSGRIIHGFIRDERTRGKAVLFSTHQMAEVELLADRVGVLFEGVLVAEGTPEELVEASGQSNLTRAFLALLGADGGEHGEGEAGAT